jgi:hypothetical protein
MCDFFLVSFHIFAIYFQVGKAELQLDVLFGPEVTVPAQKEFAQGEEVVVECQVSSALSP